MTRDYSVLEDVKASRQEILNCQYSKWYPIFKSFVTSSHIVALPHDFLQYLASDSIRLPVRDTIEEVPESLDDSDDDDDDDDADDIDPGKFIDLNDTITACLQKYQYITPKLNWSAPKDATWIMLDNTMKCRTLNDVYLLLKSSDHITHDIDHPFDESVADDNHDDTNDNNGHVQYELVLRKWKDINPALEFRVFIRNNIIVGKSQRDLNYYDYLEKLTIDEHFNHRINTFINHEVIPKFPNASFIVDIYIPRPYTKIYIIDINAFTRVTDSILYTWPELVNHQEDNIRLITETNLGRFRTKAYSESQVPMDVVHASNDTSALVELAKQWQQE